MRLLLSRFKVRTTNFDLSNKLLVNLGFLTISLIYFTWQFKHLSEPLFWDEIGVYGRGVFEMLDNKQSLHPEALSPNISRGHPLMFHYLYSTFAKFTNGDVFCLRLFSLLLSLAVLNFTLLFTKGCDPLFKFSFLILLIAQPIFQAQSILILPELLVLLLTLLAVWSYVEERHLFFFAIASYLVLVKETSVIIVGAIIFYDMCRRVYMRRNVLHSFGYAFSFLPLLIFFIIQKQSLGWYFFPYHTSGFNLDWGPVSENFIRYCSFIFLEQHRFSLVLVLGLVFLVSLYQKDVKHLLRLTRYERLSLMIILFLTLFYSTTFYMNRYVLVCVGLFIMFFSSFVLRAFNRLDTKVKYAFVLTVLMLQFVFQNHMWTSKEFSYDEDFSFLRYNAVQKEVVSYIDSKNLSANKLNLVFPLNYAFHDPRYGFYSGKAKVPSYSVASGATDVILIWPPGGPQGKDGFQYSLIKQWVSNGFEVKHYKVSPIDDM